MNKKIIAAAIAASTALPMTASADNQVTVYGKVHLSVDYSDEFNGTNSDNELGVHNRNSRLGFKGHESLGNGIRAIWQAETNYDFAGGSANGAGGKGGFGSARNTFIGLKSRNFGTITIGRHDTPYKRAAAKLDMFVDTSADYNINVGFKDKRISNAVTYTSPKMSGVKIMGAIYTPNDTETKDVNAYSIAVMYKGGPIFASLAYENGQDLSLAAGQPGLDEQKIKLGLGFKMSGLKLNAIIESVKDQSGIKGTKGDKADGERYQVQASYSFGSNTIKGMLGFEDDDLSINGQTGRRRGAIGYDYNMSKRTRLYAIYVDSYKHGGYDDLSFGMIHNF